MVTPRIVTSGAVTVASTSAVEHRARPSGQHNVPINPYRTFVVARRKFDDISGLRAVQHSLKRLVRSSLERLRTGEARSSGGEHRRRKNA